MSSVLAWIAAEGPIVADATYITTQVYYASDVPHLGHAYTTIAADVLARYHRLQGRSVFLLTGTDEHGRTMERLAARRGLSPQQHVDEVAAAFRSRWDTLEIGYDRFVRTTEAAHHRAALALWRRLRDGGDLYRAVHEVQYCPRCEAHYQDEDLQRGACPIHRLPCERVRQESWFFRLSRYQEPLERLVRETGFVRPDERRRELLGVLRQGLRDFAVTRRQGSWGIRLPDAPGEVLYVWVDALTSYLTGIGFPDDDETFARCWPADTHLVGKEIVRFHCLYWPALLLSAGLPLPRRVFALGWLTKDGQQISTSTGNVLDPAALASEFGADAVRHYLVRATPCGQDVHYTRGAFVARYNADLADGFGNLVQRATVLATQYGPVEPPVAARREPEERLRTRAEALPHEVATAVDSLALHEAAGAVATFVREVHRYVEATAPWGLAKSGDTTRLKVVLSHLVEAARLAAWYSWPVIPRSASEAHRRLSGHAPQVGGGSFGWADQTRSVLAGDPLFPRIDEAKR